MLRRLALSSRSATGGFTLIELLVVIAIIGILASVVLTAVDPAQRLAEAQDAGRRSDLAQMRNAIENYAAAHDGKYPNTGSVWWCEDCTSYAAKGKNEWIPDVVSQGYTKSLPRDPNTNTKAPWTCTATNDGRSSYMYRSNGDNYKLMAHCTPRTGLNRDSDAPPSAYCTDITTSPGAYSSNKFSDAAFPTNQKLKPMVDPGRYAYAYAVYSPGWMCL